jgi:hypothetical protein
MVNTVVSHSRLWRQRRNLSPPRMWDNITPKQTLPLARSLHMKILEGYLTLHKEWDGGQGRG